MRVHYVKVRVLGSPESANEGRDLLNAILPKDTEIVEGLIEPELEGGVFTRPLSRLEASLSGKKAEDFLMKILSSLDDYDFNSILEKKDLFVDDCNFYLRLSKKEAASGNFVLDSKDSIHVTVKLAAYPAKKENAIKILGELIGEAKDERKVR